MESHAVETARWLIGLAEEAVDLSARKLATISGGGTARI